MRRPRGGGTRLPDASIYISVLLLAASLVAIWAMGATTDMRRLPPKQAQTEHGPPHGDRQSPFRRERAARLAGTPGSPT